MSKAEIIAELPNLSRRDRREILDRLMELDEDREVIEDRLQLADEAFRVLDRLEEQDAENAAR